MSYDKKMSLFSIIKSLLFNNRATWMIKELKFITYNNFKLGPT